VTRMQRAIMALPLFASLWGAGPTATVSGGGGRRIHAARPEPHRADGSGGAVGSGAMTWPMSKAKYVWQIGKHQ
jgi:hypothetical protein